MNIWNSIKKWFDRTKKEITVQKKYSNKIKKIKEELHLHEKLHKLVNQSRKKRDNTKLTKAQIVRINLIWSGKNDPIPDVSNLTKLTKYCNDKLDINKSRSVYHRIVNNLGAYSSIEDVKDFKLKNKKINEKLLNTKEVSKILGVTVNSLANSRSINTKTGLNIPYIKIGGVVRYKESTIKAYLDANSFTFTNKN
jgi:hypothetical protein